MRGIFVASSGQNVGKTTVSLGLYAGLSKRLDPVGFIKPVGQEWVEAKTGEKVDKDILLFRERFGLSLPPEVMSPVLLPRGFTTSFLDGEIEVSDLKCEVDQAFSTISKSYPFTLVEGTGHMGVGSLIGLNNAQVAERLNLPIVLVVPGGIGSTFDQIALNKALCDAHGVPIAGIVLNKVKPDKMEKVVKYMMKALEQWNLPLLGAIPFDPLLSTPTVADFESLFKTKLLAGEGERLYHFGRIRLITTSADVFEKTLAHDQLIITSATREDVILSTLAYFSARKGQEKLALLLTGDSPREPIAKQIKSMDIPCLVAPFSSYQAMRMISAYTAKIGRDDREKIDEAIQLVEEAIDFEMLLQNLSKSA